MVMHFNYLLVEYVGELWTKSSRGIRSRGGFPERRGMTSREGGESRLCDVYINIEGW